MDKEKRCYGCMRIKGDEQICTHCGYDETDANAEHQLPVGTVLKEQYLIGKVLGQGGFGITYMGWDLYLDIPVAVKEYFPNGQVMRNCKETTSVVSYSGDAGAHFQKNKERFMREARMLARFSDVPEVVQVKTFFLANNTAYIVMEYLSGITVKNLVEKYGPLDYDAAIWLLAPVIRALKMVHKSGLIHRDISPDNIMLQEFYQVKLLDFGAGRDVGNSQSGHQPTKSTEAILKQGYAPLEQYQGKGRIGQWTDVYAFCATLYYCLTGEVPPDAPERILGDSEISFDKEGIVVPEVLQNILRAGMELRIEDRIESMDRLYELLEENELVPDRIPDKFKKLVDSELKREDGFYDQEDAVLNADVSSRTGGNTGKSDSGKTNNDRKTGRDDSNRENNSDEIKDPDVIEDQDKKTDKKTDKSWDRFVTVAFITFMAAVVIVIGIIGVQNSNAKKGAAANGEGQVAEEGQIMDETLEALLADGVDIVEGRCGQHLSYRLHLKTGRLIIYGNGEMWNYATAEEQRQDESLQIAPWYEYRKYIREVNMSACTKVGDHAFYGCENLSVVYWGEVSHIGYGAFRDTGLTKVELPEGIRHVFHQAFYGCNNLKEVILPETLVYLETGAFAACDLETVKIGYQTNLFEDEWGNNPFWMNGFVWEDFVIRSYPGSKAQEFAERNNVAFEEMNPEEHLTLKGQCGESVYWMMDLDTGTLTLNGSGETWDYQADWYYESYMVPGYAEWFCYNSLIKKVVIYPGVTRIGINLFRELAFLETVEWGTVKQISSCSFVGTGLTVIELPEGLEIVEQSAFTYNQNLEEIIFPESVYMIGRDFYNCPNLKRFVVKGSPEFELGSEDLGYFGNDDGTTVNVTVYGRPDSSSQLLALDEGVPFVALEE